MAVKYNEKAEQQKQQYAASKPYPTSPFIIITES